MQPRWGKIGKQKIEDAGELCPKRMETVDDEILDNALKFVDGARKDGKPFFLWLNPTRMHVVTHLSPKYEALRNSDNGWTIQEAGMAQMDDIVGSVMKYLKDNNLEGDTIIVFHHRQRRRELHVARRRPDAVRRRQGHCARGRLPRTRDHALARQGSGWQGRERHRVWPRLVTDLRRGGGQLQRRRGTAEGQAARRQDVQGAPGRLQPDGPDHRQGPSARHEIFYFTEGTLSAVRIDDFKYRFTDQPQGWLGASPSKSTGRS